MTLANVIRFNTSFTIAFSDTEEVRANDSFININILIKLESFVYTRGCCFFFNVYFMKQKEYGNLNHDCWKTCDQ